MTDNTKLDLTVVLSLVNKITSLTQEQREEYAVKAGTKICETLTKNLIDPARLALWDEATARIRAVGVDLPDTALWIFYAALEQLAGALAIEEAQANTLKEIAPAVS